jgi:redox-sensitive bicupin YhaK (pirin superfamily)
VTPAHFHEHNQFQVFVEGEGRIGAHPTTPVTVQYANGHTPYGPIVASAAGVQYFTLRQRWDPGAKYLPASREKLVTGNQRARVKGGLRVSTEAERMERRTEAIDTIFATELDGLAGWLYRLGPKQTCALPEPTKGGGQYLVVASGAMVSGGIEYARHSVGFIAPDETAFTVAAGATGLDLLVLQFPVASSRAMSAP